MRNITISIPTMLDAKRIGAKAKAKAVEIKAAFKEGYDDAKALDAAKDEIKAHQAYIAELEARVLCGYEASMKQVALTAHLEGELAQAGIKHITSPFTWPIVDTQLVTDSLILARRNCGLSCNNAA